LNDHDKLKYSSDAVLAFDVQPEGVYLYIKLSQSSLFPEFDYLLDTLDLAIDFCVTDLGIPIDIVLKYIPRNKS
jgi:hypothetical protein